MSPVPAPADGRPPPDCRHKPRLTGSRVELRPFQAGDADAMGAILDDPDLLRLTGSVETSEAAAAGFTPDDAFREWYASRNDQDERLDLAVVERSSGTLVGEVVLNEWDRAARRCNLRGSLAAGSITLLPCSSPSRSPRPSAEKTGR